MIKKKQSVHRTVLFILTNIFLFLTGNLTAQNNLQFYLDAAYRNNPSILENTNLIRIDEIDKLLIERQYSYPQVSLTANYLFSPYFNNNGKLVTTTPDPKAVGYDIGITNGGLYSALVNVEKNIFNGGMIDAYEQQTELKRESSENANIILQHTIIRDITEQYLNTYKSQMLFQLEKTLYDTVAVQFKITEKLVRSGLAKQSDFLLLKIELDSRKIAVEYADNEFKKNFAELNTLCGIKERATVVLQNAELQNEDSSSKANFLKQFTLDSLSLNNQQKIFETKYKPQVNLFLNTGLNAVELNDIQKKFGLSAGINFSLPIYDGNQNSLNQQQTEIFLKTITAYKENQIITVLNKTNQALTEIDFYKRNLEKLTEQIASYEQLLNLAHAELLNGQRSMTEYILLIRNYLEMKKNLVETENNYKQAINQYNYWNW